MPWEDRRMTNLSERLRSIRSYLDLSQDGMSERFGLGVGGWKRLEKEGRTPKDEVLAALFAAGIDLNWLLTGANPGGLWVVSKDGTRVPYISTGAAATAPPALDEQLLAETLKLIDDWLSANRRTMTAARKAQIAASIYAMAMDDAAEGRPALDAKRIAHILKLAG